MTLLANALEGALNNVDVEIVGVFQSFSNDYDARAIKISLTAAQELLVTQGCERNRSDAPLRRRPTPLCSNSENGLARRGSKSKTRA